MRTALDTNVISALWSNEPSAEFLVERLWQARQDGAVLFTGVVYAELLAYPKATEEFIRSFAARTGVSIQLSLTDEVWNEAGRRFAKYVQRCREHGVIGPKRLLADFLVGAHALFQADRLMTLDEDRYTRDFPDLLLYR